MTGLGGGTTGTPASSATCKGAGSSRFRRTVKLVTAQAWFAGHPTIEIVARDRGGGYGEAAAKALPHAVQVADRRPFDGER
jgi:hypothetical protein